MRKVNFARTSQRGVPTTPLNTSIQVTTLPNKLRVATENSLTPGNFSTVGLYIDAGSRFETPSNEGVSRFVSRMAFQSTRSMSGADMAAAMSALGGEITCTVQRETIIYRSSHFHKATPLALSLISETVQNASLLPEELDAQRAAAKCDIQELRATPEELIPEILHYYAYNGEGLGYPLLCHEDRVNSIDASLIRDFMTQWYQPERMVLAGTGMAHEELVELAEKYFSSLKSTSTADVCPVIRSTYSGCYKFIHDPELEFEHIYITFEGTGIHDDDTYELATMNVLLNGDGSFSPSGEPVGMYSRLWEYILDNQGIDQEAINECASFHHVYNDSSLFGLSAQFAPSARTTVLPFLVHQLALLLYRAVPEDELSRAKNWLKGNIPIALEAHTVGVGHLGLPLVHNYKLSSSELVDKFDSVTAESLQRVAQRVFGKSGGLPTVLVVGTHDMGDLEASVPLRQYLVGPV